MDLTVNNEYIRICPHCGNKSSHVVLFEAPTYETIYPYPDDTEEKISYSVFLLQCKSCQDFILIDDFPYSFDAIYYQNGDATPHIIYPKNKELYRTVPQNIRKSYEEALKVKKISPIAFVVMIRRALEFICIDQKAKGDDLQEKISYMSEKKLIPDKLSDMAESIRLLGNIGVHDTKNTIEFSESEILNDFYLALVEYIYEAPEKIKNLKDSLNKKKKS